MHDSHAMWPGCRICNKPAAKVEQLMADTLQVECGPAMTQKCVLADDGKQWVLTGEPYPVCEEHARR